MRYHHFIIVLTLLLSSSVFAQSGVSVTPTALSFQPRLAMQGHSWEMLTEGTYGYEANGGVSVSLGMLSPGDTTHSEQAIDSIGTGLGQILVDISGGCADASGLVELGIEGHGPAGTVNVSVFAQATDTQVALPALLSELNGIELARDASGTDCGDVEVFWLHGQQQEIAFDVPVTGLDSLSCTDGSHQVLFNGRAGLMIWESTSERCLAGVTNFYFPARAVVTQEAPATDYYMWSSHYADEILGSAADPTMIESEFDMEFTSYPYRGVFFNNDSEADDIRVRPLLVELGVHNGATLDIVDRARIMFWENGRGKLSLMDAGPVPGASALLSADGLDRLEEVHNTMVPYPSFDAFNADFATRLRSVSWNAGEFADDLVIPMSSLSSDEQDYFTTGTAPTGNVYDWEGSVAYDAIKAEAQRKYVAYLFALNACRSAGQAGCKTALAPFFCVRDWVSIDDFNLRVEGLSTRFSQSQAHTIANASNVDLSFRDAPHVGVISDKALQGLSVVMEADLLPHVTIEYKRSCTFNVGSPPTPQRLSEQAVASSDPHGWSRCSQMLMQAFSMGLESSYALNGNGDALDTTADTWSGSWSFLPGADLSGAGTCNASWMDPLTNVAPIVDAWKPFVESTTADAWAAAESEALDRLLSPLEIGRSSVDSGVSPPFALYPHDYFDHHATIGTAMEDLFGVTTSTADGLYVPFMTSTEPLIEAPADWLWPCFGDLGCEDGHQTGYPNAGMDYFGINYDIGIELTHMAMNQIMWGQALDPDLLGSLDAPHVIDDDPAIIHRAVAPGNPFVDAHPEGFEVHIYATRPPFFVTPEGTTNAPLSLVVPQVIVEIYSASDPDEVLADFTIDIVDRDYGLHGIGPRLNAEGLWSSWTRSLVTAITLPFGCPGTPQGSPGGCESDLTAAIQGVIAPMIRARVNMMAEQNPTPGIWDAGGEASKSGNGLERAPQQGGGYQIGFFGGLSIQ